MIYSNSWEKYVGNRMIYQGLIVCLFLLFIYDNMIVYYSLLAIIIALICLKLITLYRNEEKDNKTRLSMFYHIIYLIISIVLIFQTQNYLFSLMDNGFSQFYFKFDLSIDFISTWKIIFEYFGILTISSFAIELSVTIYYWRSKMKINPSDLNKTQTLFEYFLTDRSAKKWFLLVSLLSFASIYEEIVYRFFLINIFIFIINIFNIFMSNIGFPFPLIPLNPSIFISIFIASFIFGLAHKENGGWSYVVNSLVAGIVFSLCFIWYGIIPTWILHFLWNFLIILQTLATIMWKEKTGREFF